MAPSVASVALLATVDCGDPIADDVTVAPDAAMADVATGDTLVTDADAGADAALILDCPPAARVCEHFDDGDGYIARWSEPTGEQGDASAALEEAGQTAPNAFRVKTPAAEAGVPREYTLQKRIAAQTKLTCAFSVRVPASSPDNDVINIIWASGDAGSGSIWIDSSTSQSRINANPGDVRAPARKLPPDRWTRIEIETDFAKVTVRYDGEVQTNGVNIAPTDGFVVVKVGSLNLESEATDVLYDDVFCTAE